MLLLLCTIYLDCTWTYCILLIRLTAARSYSSVFKSIMSSGMYFIQLQIIITTLYQYEKKIIIFLEYI